MDELLLSKSVHVEESPSSRVSLSSNFPASPSVISINATPTSSYINLLANINRSRKLPPQRCHSAPPLFMESIEDFSSSDVDDTKKKGEYFCSSTSSIVMQAFIGVIVYIVIGLVVYTATSSDFKVQSKTFKLIDGLYFSVVTLCTIGYGDITPNTTFSKLFTCGYILVGFGLIDIVLNGLIVYVLNRQEAVLLSALDENRINLMLKTYMIDTNKGRMRIRIKVCLALGVVVACIAIGTVMAHVLESLNWIDSVYLSVTSVTTVGYGDYAFKTVGGRCFAILWLLVSTLAVARAFLYLTDLRIDKRNRAMAELVLQKKITSSDLVAADLDNNGSISKSEYVIYKLKEMGKIAQKDISQICNQFDRLDTGNCGKITLADLMEHHH